MPIEELTEVVLIFTNVFTAAERSFVIHRPIGAFHSALIIGIRRTSFLANRHAGRPTIATANQLRAPY